jgi:hypothetical protein
MFCNTTRPRHLTSTCPQIIPHLPNNTCFHEECKVQADSLRNSVTARTVAISPMQYNSHILSVRTKQGNSVCNLPSFLPFLAAQTFCFSWFQLVASTITISVWIKRGNLVCNHPSVPPFLATRAFCFSWFPNPF